MTVFRDRRAALTAGVGLVAGALGIATAVRVATLPPWTGRRRVATLAAEALGAGETWLLAGGAGLLLAGVLAALALPTWRWRRCSLPRAARTWAPLAWGAAAGLLVPWVDPWAHHSVAPLLPVAGVALGGAVGLRRCLLLPPADCRPPGWLAAALIATAAFLLPAVLASPWTPQWHKLLGDEPHYLLMAHSVLVDGDLELADNYLDEDYFHFFPSHGLPPHTRPGLEEGSRYSFHGYGLAFWLVPWYALATGLDVETFAAVVRTGMAPWMLLLAPVLWALLRDVAGRRAAAWGTPAAVLGAPVVLNVPHLFPDLPAMALSCLAYWLLRRRPGPGGASLAGLALGFLPWLHFKFLGLQAVLAALGVVWLLVPRWAPALGSDGSTGGSRRRLAVLALLAGVGLGLGSHMAYTWTVHGKLSPLSVAVGARSMGREIMHGDDLSAYLADPVGALRTAVGLFLDQKEGWLFYAPQALLAIPGIVWMARRRRRDLLALALVLASYLGPVALSQNVGHWSPAGRWILAVGWVLALLAGTGMVHPSGPGRSGRALAWVRGGLLGLGAALTLVYLGTNELALNDLGVSHSLLLQHYGGPGLEPWRLFPLLLPAAGSGPRPLVTWLWCGGVAAAVLALLLLSRAAAGSEGGRGAGSGEDRRLPAVELRGALSTGALVAILLLAWHVLVPLSAPGLYDSRDYGDIRVSVPSRPAERAWVNPGATWFGGATTARAVLSASRPVERIEIQVMALTDMDGVVQVGTAVSSVPDLAAREVRRLVLRPGSGTRWRGRWYYPIRVRSGGAAPAALLGDADDVRMLGLNVLWSDVTLRRRGGG